MTVLLRRRLAVVAAVVLIAGMAITVAVDSANAGDAPSDSAHPARAVAPGDPDPEVEAASLRVADPRAPRPADAPLFATLAVIVSLAALTFAGLGIRRRSRHGATVGLVACGPRAPPLLLVA